MHFSLFLQHCTCRFQTSLVENNIDLLILGHIYPLGIIFDTLNHLEKLSCGSESPNPKQEESVEGDNGSFPSVIQTLFYLFNKWISKWSHDPRERWLEWNLSKRVQATLVSILLEVRCKNHHLHVKWLKHGKRYNVEMFLIAWEFAKLMWRIFFPNITLYANLVKVLAGHKTTKSWWIN